jgi:hypothetical protein
MWDSVDWIHMAQDKGTGEFGYEPSGSVKGKGSSEWLSDCYLPKKDSTTWSYNSYTTMTYSQRVGRATM